MIASGHGACPEVIGETGLLVKPPSDPGAWAEAMLRLAADAARRDELAKLAAERAGERFTLSAVVDQYLAVLHAAGSAKQ